MTNCVLPLPLEDGKLQRIKGTPHGVHRGGDRSSPPPHFLERHQHIMGRMCRNIGQAQVSVAHTLKCLMVKFPTEAASGPSPHLLHAEDAGEAQAEEKKNTKKGGRAHLP